MPTFFPTTNSPLDIRFTVGTIAGIDATMLNVDFGHDCERYIIPESVVQAVKGWPDYQHASEESRAKLLLIGLLQHASSK